MGGVLLSPSGKTCPPSLGHFRANLGSGFCYKSVTQWACGLILYVAFSDHWLFPSIHLLGPEADLCSCFPCSSVLSKQGCRSRHFLPVAFLFSLHHSCFPPPCYSLHLVIRFKAEMLWCKSQSLGRRDGLCVCCLESSSSCMSHCMDCRARSGWV